MDCSDHRELVRFGHPCVSHLPDVCVCVCVLCVCVCMCVCVCCVCVHVCACVVCGHEGVFHT